MNVLFLTMSPSVANVRVSGIYTDLMRCFRNNGHNVYVVYPSERRKQKPTSVGCIDSIHTLGVYTLNLTKSSIIEKGIGQLLLEFQFYFAILRYYKDIRFDLILYTTPPITFTNILRCLKYRHPKAKVYLLLKDIFPQNAVDLGLLSIHGMRGLMFRLYRQKEKALYRLSDFIGCMSPANIKYLLEHNSEISVQKVEIAPNSYEVIQFPKSISVEERKTIRKKYGLPIDVPIFVYGGNLGKPQGIPFLIDCLRANSHRKDCHFLVVGNGTEFHMLEKWFNLESPASVTLLHGLPKQEYDMLMSVCEVGLIFLDYRFTIPNYPSRLLPYMMEKKPIIAVTDESSDVGRIAVENGYGIWVPSNSVMLFSAAIDKMLHSDIQTMGESAYQYFISNYTVQHTYNAIVSHFSGN